uniref:CLK4-associating serine/arginine rich protein n=2 Tax=Schistocephalus solidus TaxID=70667 RepID=A0A0V0J4U7_SCHSO
MWHEARKQEKHIRSILIDYRKRAERRQDFYARIRQDPIKFLRVYGTRAKINLDADIVKAAENPKTMMRWTADPSVVIDRFDARANLDQYSEPTLKEIKLTTLEKIEERLCNYERYRCLVQNDFLGVTEAMTLKQIEMDEKFGDLEERKKAKEEEEEKKKKLQEGKAAINFVYEENEPLSGTAKPVADDSSESECEADSDMDIDVELDLSTLTGEQRRRLCKHGLEYKMKSSDFIRLLDADQQLETELRLAKAMEEEKSHLVRKPRGRQIRDRRTLERFAKPLGPKIGLLNGQPITRRKIYLSGASSDSESYESPSSVEGDSMSAEGLQRRQNRSRFPPPPPPARDHDAPPAIPSQTMCTNPNLFESRRPAVPIGGLTMVSFCRPHRRHRGADLIGMTNRGNRSSHGLGDGDVTDSSSSGSPTAHRRGRKPGPRRSRVEYITTFGGEDDEGEGGQAPGSSGGGEQTRRAPPDPLAHRPLGSTASALAASVVSSMLSKPAVDHTGRGRPSNRARSRNRSTSSSSHRRRRSPGSFRRQRPSVSSSSSRSSSRRDSQRFGRSRSGSRTSSPSRRLPKRIRPDNASLSPVSRRDPDRAFRNRSRSPSKKGSEILVPVKRYYRPELESDEEKSALSAIDSDSSDSQRNSSPHNSSCQRASSSFIEPSGRRRYFSNLGESGDFYGSGGKKSFDETRSDDRFSTATHSSHTSATTTTPSTQVSSV